MSTKNRQEERAFQAGRDFGEANPLKTVKNTEQMYQAATAKGVGLLFDVFKYGAQAVWREKGEL